MNWGVKITIGMGIFMLLILGMVTIAMRQNIELESEDYYARELVYEEQLQKFRNAEKQGWLPIWTLQPGCLSLKFITPVTATVKWIRPSALAQDFISTVKTDSAGKLEICDSRLVSGMWRAELNWSQAGKNCYQQQNLNIP